MLDSGALLPANVSLAPSYDFQTENPWVYQEDHDVRVERVDRPRMFPHVNLPQVLELSMGNSSNIDISLVEELHNVTGRFLSQVRGQPASVPASTISTVPAPTSTIQSSDVTLLPELVPGSRTCPVCSKVFREINKLKIHYATQHKKESDFICVKCKKVLGTAASLATHIDSFHKYRNYTCIYCQYSCQYKREITKHMKQHPHWVAHPEFRCAFCVQCLHNKDGLFQHIKSCKHNPHKQTGYFMCRKPGCGSVFSLEKKRNYHERHLCDLLKKNIGRGRGQSQ